MNISWKFYGLSFCRLGAFNYQKFESLLYCIYRGIFSENGENGENGLNCRKTYFFSKFYEFGVQKLKIQYFLENWVIFSIFAIVPFFISFNFDRKIQYGPFYAWNQFLMVKGHPSDQNEHLLKILWHQLLSSWSF